jgi:hypothetical protein
MSYDGLIPVPPHLWHLTILSPFLKVPFPSQFLHGFFFSPELFGNGVLPVQPPLISATLSVSSAINFPKSAGVIGIATQPGSASRSLILESECTLMKGRVWILQVPLVF